MNLRTMSAIVLLAGALAFTGCSAPSTDATRSAPAETRAPSQPATPDATGSPSDSADDVASDPTTLPVEGAYVDYVDGAIEATPGPKVLFFHAGWCPQCRQLDEDLRTAGAPDGLTVMKVDYDSRTDLRQKYGVTLQTTVVFVDDQGELISSAVLYDDPSVKSLVAAIP